MYTMYMYMYERRYNIHCIVTAYIYVTCITLSSQVPYEMAYCSASACSHLFNLRPPERMMAAKLTMASTGFSCFKVIIKGSVIDSKQL